MDFGIIGEMPPNSPYPVPGLISDHYPAFKPALKLFALFNVITIINDNLITEKGLFKTAITENGSLEKVVRMAYNAFKGRFFYGLRLTKLRDLGFRNPGSANGYLFSNLPDINVIIRRALAPETNSVSWTTKKTNGGFVTAHFR